MLKLKKLMITWWQQLIGIPIALLLFMYAPQFIYWLDDTSAPLDAGVLHIVNFAMVQLLIYNALAWIGIVVSFPVIAKFFTTYFEPAFINLTNYQKCVIALFILFAYIFALVLLSLAL
jgi:hypothetical protein